MAEKINIAEFKFDASGIEEAYQANVKLKKSIVELKSEQKKTNAVIKENGEITEENAKALSENDAELKKLNASYRDNLKVISASNSSNAKMNKLLDETVKTENQAINSNRKLIEIRKGLNYKKDAVLIADINKKIDGNNKVLDANADSYSAQKRNIGNYASALDGLDPRLSKGIKQVQQMIVGLKLERQALRDSIASTNAKTTATTASTKATMATNKGLKLFRIALISTGVGALAIALGLLINYFTSTQKGMDAVTRAVEPLKIVFQSLVGVVQDMGEKISNAFSNPKQAVINLWNAIKENLVNRVTAIGGIFKSLGKIISSGFTDGYEDFANATLQLTTGVEDVIGKVKDATKNTGEFFDEALKRGGKIAELGIEISKQESEIAGKRERNLNLIREQELITKDKSKSQAEINTALKEAERLTKETLKNDNDIIRLKIEKTKLENESNDTNREDLKELNELEAQLETNKGKARGIELRFLGAKNRLQAQATAESNSRTAKQIAQDKKRATDTIKNLEIELDLYELANNTKLESDDKLNDEFVKSKLDYFAVVNQMELDNLKFRFENGLIKENEYNLKKLTLESNFETQKKELKAQFREQEKADEETRLEEERTTKQLEFELQLEENSVKRQTEYERKLADESLQYENDKVLLEQKLIDEEITQDTYDRQSEVNRKKHLKIIADLEKDSADKAKKIEEIKQAHKIKGYSDALGGVVSLLGKETKAGKIAGVAQALVNTYQGVTRVWNTKSILPEPFATASKAVNTGVVLASGLSAVKEIKKAEDGMLVGNSHANGGIQIEAEGGEGIVNNRSMSNPFLRNIVSAINVWGGGVDFSTQNTSGIFQDGGTVASGFASETAQRVETKVVLAVDEMMTFADENITQVQLLASN